MFPCFFIIEKTNIKVPEVKTTNTNIWKRTRKTFYSIGFQISFTDKFEYLVHILNFGVSHIEQAAKKFVFLN